MLPLIALTAVVAQAHAAMTNFDIPAQPLADSLRAVATQTNTNVLFDPPLVAAVRAPALQGELTATQAFTYLLNGTGIKHEFISEKTVVIVRSDASTPSPETGEGVGKGREMRSGGERLNEVDVSANLWKRLRYMQSSSSSSSGVRSDSDQPLSRDGRGRGNGNSTSRIEEGVRGGGKVREAVPEVLVRGSAVLNMDIPRTRDDVQPYVVFDRAAIERSGAASLEEFFKQRLTMNASTRSNSQVPATANGASSINLRSLGANQTLILIDGRRTSSMWSAASSAPGQPDISGVPLSAIERIEVLPTTASGIHGGAATGGVVNIVLRRDYAGTDLHLGYENTFDGDAAARRVEIGSGFTLEQGRTRLLFTGAFSDSNPLLVGERDLLQRGRAHILANNPALFLNAAPPAGATPNIRSATSVGGVLQNLTLKGSNTPLNSTITFLPAGYRGVAQDGTAALVANAGGYNLDLPDTAQLGGRQLGLLSVPKNAGLSMTARREFSSSLQAFVELSASDVSGYTARGHVFSTAAFTLPASSPANPFNQAIQVRAPLGPVDDSPSKWTFENNNRRAAAGVIVRLPRRWLAEADYTWSYSKNRQDSPPTFDLAGASAAVASGALPILRDTSVYPLDFSGLVLPGVGTIEPLRSILKEASLRLSGPTLSLPAGALIVTGVISRRDEVFKEGSFYFGPDETDIFPQRSQTVDSAYLEALVPLVTAKNERPGVRELELQVAARIDDYAVNAVTSAIIVGPDFPPMPVERVTNRNDSLNPTVGVRYRPIDDVVLRASYGTGFLPPAVNQLIPSFDPTPSLPFFDPKRGGTQFTLPAGTLRGGGNPNIRPEESEAWSVGTILTPRFLPGLRLSVDYSRIVKTDNITNFPGGIQALINNEDEFRSRFTRGPNLPGDAPGWAGPITALDATLFNIARAEVEAYDVQLDYELQTESLGQFLFYGLATWHTHFLTQTLAGQPTVERVGFSPGFAGNFPLKFKGNAGLNWSRKGWTFGWNARYFDSYLTADPNLPTNARFFLAQGNNGRVPGQMYHDVFARFRLADSDRQSMVGRVLAGLEIQAGVRNVFNKRPPVDVNDSLQMYYSYFGDPRLASYHLSVKQSF